MRRGSRPEAARTLHLACLVEMNCVNSMNSSRSGRRAADAEPQLMYEVIHLNIR